ncbi:MAG: hypothetical protein L6V89_10185 [Oscillospiraceae bacterium]|nr:MAG: hypothetical protein L6V89_10185 [Oscillospiraceae bacterium]
METDTEKQTEKTEMPEGVCAEAERNEGSGQEAELARLKELVAELGRENERWDARSGRGGRRRNSY